MLTVAGFFPGSVVFEIEDAAAPTKLDGRAHQVTKLRKNGGASAIDNFGGAIRSICYLKQLQVD